MCDIIIPVWNELESTRECVERLKKFTAYPYRLIAVDNGSLNPTRDYLEGLKNVFPSYLLIRNNTNVGFVKAVNQAIRESSAAYLCILNNDAYVAENWLSSLVKTLEKGPSNIGLANPTSNVFGKSSPDGKEGEFQELDSCKGFALIIKREVIEKIGLFDEVYGMGYFEEKDFSRRAREAGYISVRVKSSFVFHKDKLSFNKLKDRDEIFKVNEAIYNERWGRPQSIAFAAKNKNNLENKKDFIYELLNKGNRVHIFCLKDKKLPEFKDHIEMRRFPISKAFFEYIILFKLWKRRRKKKIELIFTEDGDMLRFFDRFKFIHGAGVAINPALSCGEYSKDTTGVSL